MVYHRRMRLGVALLLLLCGCSYRPLAMNHSGDTGAVWLSDAPLPIADTAEINSDGAVATDLPSGPDTGATISFDAEGDARHASDSACVSLELQTPPAPSAAICPPNPGTAACTSQDQGAIVARSSECLLSWGAVPQQCLTWPSLEENQELVVLTLRSCANDFEVLAARLCGDHIEVETSEVGAFPLASCGGVSVYRLLILPLDPRPVIVTNRYLPDIGG